MYKNESQFVLKSALLGLILITSCLVLPTAVGQGIFSELSYDENYIRSKIDQHALKYDSVTNPGAIPENIYYRLTFREILSDPSLFSHLSDDDKSIIEKLPAHEHHAFILKDQQELTALCSRLSVAAILMGVVYLVRDEIAALEAILEPTTLRPLAKKQGLY